VRDRDRSDQRSLFILLRQEFEGSATPRPQDHALLKEARDAMSSWAATGPVRRGLALLLGDFEFLRDFLAHQVRSCP
jgi:hypothetical protein